MRQLYSVRKDRLGIVFKPANNASPSSRTALITWGCRRVLKSFSAKRLRKAWAAGTICVPGRPHGPITRSKRISASAGRNKNSPPNLVRTLRGSSDSARTSARSACVGFTRLGRAGNVFLLQRRADIVDGEVLFAQCEDLLPHPVGWFDAGACRWGKERAVGGAAQLMHQLMKAAQGVAEPLGDFRSRQSLDEVGPQGLVLPVVGIP